MGETNAPCIGIGIGIGIGTILAGSARTRVGAGGALGSPLALDRPPRRGLGNQRLDRRRQALHMERKPPLVHKTVDPKSPVRRSLLPLPATTVIVIMMIVIVTVIVIMMIVIVTVIVIMMRVSVCVTGVMVFSADLAALGGGDRAPVLPLERDLRHEAHHAVPQNLIERNVAKLRHNDFRQRVQRVDGTLQRQ